MSGLIKYYNGSEFEWKPIKLWDGSAWVTKPLKYWNGSEWVDDYLNNYLTDELYKRASEYENSWVTDQILKGIGTKPSIILTPTAYEDGVLNSVKPSDGNADFDFTRGSSATRVNELGLVQDVTDTDLPRINYTNFDYENGEVVPYSGEGSLLLEPQRSNLLPYSEDFSQWVKTGGATINETNITSPSGQNNATNISGLNGSGGNDLRFFPLGFNSANKTLSFSLYLKGSGTLSLQMSNGVDQAPRETITLTSNWKRHILTTTFNSTTSSGFHVNIDDYNSATATSYDIWGAQLEEGYATSYIPTNGSTVTRLADVCNNSGSSDLINSTEGVLYAEISALANYNTQRWISVSDGSHSNSVKIGLYNNATDFRFAVEVRSANSTQAFMTYNFGAITPIMTKVAIKFKQNDFALWINGTEIATYTNGNTPTGLNELAFDRGDGGQVFEGNVKCIAVFKEALSDTELQKLTTI